MFKILCGIVLLSILSEGQTADKSCAALEICPVICSVFTPFKTNGYMKSDVIPEYAQYLKNNGILDILVSAYIGEGGSLNLCDRSALISAWVDAAIPLGIGVLVEIAAGLPFIDILILAKLCLELNVKAIVVLPQTIYPPQTVDEAVAELKLIANVAVGIPIIYEDINAFESGGVVTTTDIIEAAVAQIPCLVGVITSTNAAFKIKATPSIGNKLIIIIGGHESISASVQLKFSANVNSLTNLFPGLVLHIVAAVRAGDFILAEKLQAELNQKVAVVIGDGDIGIRLRAKAYIVNQKVALALITRLKIAIPRLPLVTATVEVANQIANALTELDVPLVSTVTNVLGVVD